MSIKKVDGKYQVDCRPFGSAGKRVVRLFSSKSEANYFQNNLLSSLEPHKKDTTLLGELIGQWYQLHGKSLKSSLDTKNRLLAFSVALKNPIAFELTANDYASYRSDRLTNGLKPATLNRELSTLKAMFRELKRLGVINYDSQLLNIRKIKEKKTELSYLDQEQIEKLLKSVTLSKNNSLYYVVMLCLASGSRWSEAESITEKSLNAGGVTFHDTKNGLSRFVPLDQSMIDLLRGYLEINKTFDSCYSAFRSALERSAVDTLPGQSAHVLRHTFASHFVMNGGNIRTLQTLLGHSSLNVTMRYAHLSIDFLEQAKTLNPIALFKIK